MFLKMTIYLFAIVFVLYLTRRTWGPAFCLFFGQFAVPSLFGWIVSLIHPPMDITAFLVAFFGFLVFAIGFLVISDISGKRINSILYVSALLISIFFVIPYMTWDERDGGPWPGLIRLYF